MSTSDRRYHLDRRAGKLSNEVAGGGDPDELLSDLEVAELTGTSIQFWQILRVKGQGPTFVRLSPRKIRTRRADLADWLNQRTHRSSADYGNGRSVGRQRGSRVIDGKVIPPD